MTPAPRPRPVQPNVYLIVGILWCAAVWAVVVHLLVALAG